MKNHEFNDKEFEEAWNSPYSTISDNEIEDSWSSFRKNIITDEKKERNYAIASAAAALFILLFTSYFFLEIYNPIVTIENSAKVDKEVVLPDGSLVLLKKGSEISYRSDFRNSREVELKGAAFFDVVPDRVKEFKVITQLTTTIALGTAFLVTEQPGVKDTEINLFSGRILVSVNGLPKSWALIKGEKFIYRNKNAVVKEFSTSLSFDEGESYKDLNYTELEKVLTFLEERFGYKIVTSDYTLKKRVTLRINKADSLHQILNLLSIINNTNYEINQETKEIEIFSK